MMGDSDDDDVDECGGVGVDGVSDFVHCHHVCASVIDGRSEAAKWLCSIACLIRSISMSDVLRLQSLVYSPNQTKTSSHHITLIYSPFFMSCHTDTSTTCMHSSRRHNLIQYSLGAYINRYTASLTTTSPPTLHYTTLFKPIT
ncbi:hypothetical protein KSF78_0004466 [Schistosoma japonicum]|nr:hypothetical protein KSF78_0004466 [Schistosoma japonicum]